MVHALEQLWEVLKPGGHLVDMRPISYNCVLEVILTRDSRQAGIIDDSEGVPDEDAADRAIAYTVRRGLYKRLDTQKFDFSNYWDNLAEMQAYVQERWSDIAVIPEDSIREARRLLAGAAGKQTRIRVRYPVRIVTYLKPKNAAFSG